MNHIEIIRIIIYILSVALGGLALYWKGNALLNGKVAALIAQAEERYKDLTKAGGQKFEWVVDQLYTLIPAPIRPFISRELIGTIVQSVFDAVEGYAKLQLDKLGGAKNG